MKHLRLALAALLSLAAVTPPLHAEFQAGAAIVDVTPNTLPVLVNGGVLSRSVGKVKTPVKARAFAFSDGTERIVSVIVDSCMIGRTLLDQVKADASAQTGIPTNHILISATHSHSAPASMGCLGTDADPAYVPFLKARLVDAIREAIARLQPAEIGFGRINASDYTALRQWIRRPDRIEKDPFGNPTVRANMHAGAKWENVTGEAGPKDPELSLISVRTPQGKPLAVLANFSMHYFSDTDISADYFGLFSEGLAASLRSSANDSDTAVTAMSHGCSGDIWRRDYTNPDAWNPKLTIDEYANGLVQLARKAIGEIQHTRPKSIAMQEARLPMSYRVPDAQRLEWAERIVREMGDRLPKNQTEVYAREQVMLNALQHTEVVVQGIRLGDIGIATTPCETYAVTGLKIKAASPLPDTMVIELANGGDGYIPPPEQHRWGGYNTWPARSAGLEVNAEPRITETAIALLEKVSNRPRRDTTLPIGPLTKQSLQLKPFALLRLNDSAGPIAIDASGNGHHATYEPDITYLLEGPTSDSFSTPAAKNRAPHLVGGRIRHGDTSLHQEWTASLWIWNGMPDDSRPTLGWFLSRGPDNGLGFNSFHAGIQGTDGVAGTLILRCGDKTATAPNGIKVPRWTWTHVCIVKDTGTLRGYINGELQSELVLPQISANQSFPWFFGGRSDNDSNWEGRLDEISLYPRALSQAEIKTLLPTSPR
jgi:hypothetical protein